jgi:pyruvate dehydrogenase E2 component (dihydrolipoamide acetyltransferase)
MAAEPVKVPDLGDVDKVDVVEVLVAHGDRVEVDTPLITLESDKASMDVPSPLAGKVAEVQVKAGDEVGEGDLILTLEVSDDEPAAEEAPKSQKSESQESGSQEGESQESESDESQAEGEEPPPTPEPAAAAPPSRPSAAAPGDGSSLATAYASPAVRRFARELGVDLSRVQGTGRKGRIVRSDVQGWVKKTLSEPAVQGSLLPEMPVIDFSRFGETERVALTRVQKISGPNLQRSWLNVPHVTQHDEADVTELEAFRQEHKAAAKAEGYNLTPLAFVLKAVVAALERFPKVNSSLDPDGEHLILKRYYHLGVAVDTDEGLMVPVLRDVDKKGVSEIARELAELSQQTRDRKLSPDKLRGASFTVSSLGGIGGIAFTPVVNAPEAAILGVSRSTMRPVWRDGEFVPRLILPLSLSYDHRIIDGALAVRFTTYLCQVLSDIRRLLL